MCCLTVSRRSRDLRPLSRDRSVTFFKKISNCLKRPKNVVWQSADGRVTSDHCLVTVQWLFSKKFQIAWNVQKRCLTVGRRSRDLRPLSCDRSVTFFKTFSNCLKRTKNVVWPSADGRVTSDHCRVTVQWLFIKNSQIAWKVQKTLFDSRPTVAWPPTTVAWPFSDFFQYFPNCLKRRKNVVWQSADGRVTVQLLCFGVFFVRLYIRWRMLSFSFLLLLLLLLLFFFLSAEQLGHVSPPTGMDQSWKFWHHIKARDKWKRILDFGGEIPTHWFPLRETSTPYLLREIPVKNRERLGRGSTHGKIVG